MYGKSDYHFFCHRLDEDQKAAEHAYAAQPLRASLTAFIARRQRLMRCLLGRYISALARKNSYARCSTLCYSR
jgi:hypothetical protein